MIIYKCLICGDIFKEEPYDGSEPGKIRVSHGFCSEKCEDVYRQEMIEDLKQWKEYLKELEECDGETES